MAKLMKNISKTLGNAPGTLVHIGKRRAESIRIELFEYSESGFEEKQPENIEDIFFCKDSKDTSWINVIGVHNTGVIEKIGQHFGIHPLVLEDIMNTSQRPKCEDFGEYLYLVLKMVYQDAPKEGVIAEQVSLILGEGYVISFQEIEGDVFSPLRNRIRKDKGLLRKKEADYLAYALMDAIIDNYFLLLEDLGETAEKIENRIMSAPTSSLLRTLHSLKRNLILFRKAIWPVREILGGLKREESRLIKKDTSLFLGDIHDHTLQAIDTVEAYRDMVSGIQDLYMSSISNKMNEVMKFLTIFATIFIPLTFIAGIYGMNFKYMPELEWQWGYFGVLGLMLAVTLVLLLYFRHKKWL